VKMLSVDVRSDGDAVTLVLSGELDLSTAPTVERELADVERDRPSLITIDLRGVSFLDSTGLRVVLSADGRARKEDRRLEVIPGPPPVHRVFRIALLDRRIRFVDPPEDAHGAHEGTEEGEFSP